MIHARRHTSLPELPSTSAETLALHSSELSTVVTHDGFLIGTHRTCDLQLADDAVPAFHSVIHMQCGSLWIEGADDEILLNINDCSCRRMSLRHGDRIQIGSSSFEVEIRAGDKNPMTVSPSDFSREALSTLSADQLCDLIETEQSMIQEFSEGRKSGWETLLHAIETVRQESQDCDEFAPAIAHAVPVQNPIDGLLAHIDQLHQLIVDRNLELNEQEVQMIDAASARDEKHLQLAKRLNEILGNLETPVPMSGLRASA